MSILVIVAFSIGFIVAANRLTNRSTQPIRVPARVSRDRRP